MKKIVYMLALAAVLSCAGCSNNAESNAAEVQGTSSQTSSQPVVTSQPEESSIEVVAGDFVFKVPESAELSDNSEDGVIQLSYLIQSEGCEYSLSEEDGEVEKYKLVTSIRGNSMENRVSIESPIGKALKGHRVGDRVLVNVNENVSYYLRVKSIDKTGDEGENIRSF